MFGIVIHVTHTGCDDGMTSSEATSCWTPYCALLRAASEMQHLCMHTAGIAAAACLDVTAMCLYALVLAEPLLFGQLINVSVNGLSGLL